MGTFTFRQLLAKRKTELNLSLSELVVRLEAQGYKVAKSTIGCWATGERNPQLEKQIVRDAIANALEMPSDVMMTQLGFVRQSPNTDEAVYAAWLIDQIENKSERVKALNVLKAHLSKE